MTPKGNNDLSLALQGVNLKTHIMCSFILFAFFFQISVLNVSKMKLYILIDSICQIVELCVYYNYNLNRPNKTILIVLAH